MSNSNDDASKKSKAIEKFYEKVFNVRRVIPALVEVLKPFNRLL